MTPEQSLNKAYYEFVNSPLGEVILQDLRETFLESLGYSPGSHMTHHDLLHHEGCRYLVRYMLDRAEDYDSTPTDSGQYL